MFSSSHISKASIAFHVWSRIYFVATAWVVWSSLFCTWAQLFNRSLYISNLSNPFHQLPRIRNWCFIGCEVPKNRGPAAIFRRQHCAHVFLLRLWNSFSDGWRKWLCHAWVAALRVCGSYVLCHIYVGHNPQRDDMMACTYHNMRPLTAEATVELAWHTRCKTKNIQSSWNDWQSQRVRNQKLYCRCPPDMGLATRWNYGSNSKTGILRDGSSRHLVGWGLCIPICLGPLGVFKRVLKKPLDTGEESQPHWGSNLVAAGCKHHFA